MKKILHLISTLDTGGAELFLRRLVAGSDGTRFKHCVASMTDVGNVGKMLRADGIDVCCLGMKKGVPDPAGIVGLMRLVNRFRPSTVQCWLYHANLLGLLAGLSRGVRVVWGIRCADLGAGTYGPIYGLTVKIGALLSPMPNLIIVNSHAGKTYHQKMGYSGNWQFVPNGIDTKVYAPATGAREAGRKALGIPGDSLVVCLIARLDPVKDHATFFTAARRLLTHKPNTHFILAGRGVHTGNPKIRACMGEGRAPGNFHLLGERDDINTLLNAADIAVSASVSEGFSNAVAEAMAAGTPVVATDVGDSRHILGNTGLWVPPKSPGALCDALKRLLDMGHEQRAYMGKMARARIIEKFGLDFVIGEYEKIWGGIG